MEEDLSRATCEDASIDEQKVARVTNTLPQQIGRVAELFKALADETRCKIVCALVNDELCVCEIARVVGSSISNTSHHLRRLKAQRLVKSRKHQRRVLYSLDDAHVASLITQGILHTGHR